MIEIAQNIPVRKQIAALVGENVPPTIDPQWADKIGELPHFTVIGDGRTEDLYSKDCIHYAGNAVDLFKSPDAYRLIQKDTYRFLMEQGFEATGTPEAGDLVGYAAKNIREAQINPETFRQEFRFPLVKKRPPFFVHWGVYEGISPSGVHYVRSKFGYGHVYRHPLTDVPPSYGSIVQFFRYEGMEVALGRKKVQNEGTIFDLHKEKEKRPSLRLYV